MFIYVSQVKPLIGNIDHNLKLVWLHYEQASKARCDVCVLPELVTTGYIPEDLLLKPSFIRELEQLLGEFIPKITNTVLLLPTPVLEEGRLLNVVLAIQNGKVIGSTSKKHLANYGIFDEKRYFTVGTPNIININGTRVGVPICEDFWFPDVAARLENLGAEMLIVVNASPYEKDKFNTRLTLAQKRFDELKLPIIYCNQVLGQDGITYDGQSFGFDGELKFSLKAFSEDHAVVEVRNNSIIANRVPNNFSHEDLTYGAMVLGLRDYVINNGFKSVLIGLSGGIDSALVAAIAVDALGAENVHTIMLPSQFTSVESLEDAALAAQMLGVTHQIIPISDMVQVVSGSMKWISALAHENLQARIRGLILMTTSNSTGSLLLTTGNKSENATGYATLYGDMCGAFNPIKDLYKTDVFKIVKFRNKQLPRSIDILNNKFPVIPDRIITKSPSAELRADQKDSDSLPEYDLLDKILEFYIEKDMGITEIINLGFDEQLVKRVANLVRISEYKRRQSPTGVKLTSKAFERERRYPITY